MAGRLREAIFGSPQRYAPRLEPTLGAMQLRPVEPKGASQARSRMFQHASLLLEETGINMLIEIEVEKLNSRISIRKSDYEKYDKILTAAKLLGYKVTTVYSNKDYVADISW